MGISRRFGLVIRVIKMNSNTHEDIRGCRLAQRTYVFVTERICTGGGRIRTTLRCFSDIDVSFSKTRYSIGYRRTISRVRGSGVEREGQGR